MKTTPFKWKQAGGDRCKGNVVLHVVLNVV